jgi:hypothetical protein
LALAIFSATATWRGRTASAPVARRDQKDELVPSVIPPEFAFNKWFSGQRLPEAGGLGLQGTARQSYQNVSVERFGTIGGKKYSTQRTEGALPRVELRGKGVSLAIGGLWRHGDARAFGGRAGVVGNFGHSSRTEMNP